MQSCLDCELLGRTKLLWWIPSAPFVWKMISMVLPWPCGLLSQIVIFLSILFKMRMIQWEKTITGTFLTQLKDYKKRKISHQNSYKQKRARMAMSIATDQLDNDMRNLWNRPEIHKIVFYLHLKPFVIFFVSCIFI